MEGTFFFDPADRIYDDHFPGNPVVPGSLIVQAFIEAAGRMRLAAEQYSVENFRFKKFVAPGEYPFRIQPLPDRLKCELYLRNETLVTGTLKT
jgi:3-hydroxyacyl-[acyl-carrier-protein] dehydratase